MISRRAMRKMLFLLSLLTVTGALLSGCGKSDPSDPQASKQVEDRRNNKIKSDK